MLKRFYLVAADTKYVTRLPVIARKTLHTYKFRHTGLFPEREPFDEDAVPLAFKTTPDSLLNLALQVIDALPLPNVYSWDIDNVCQWLKDYGYPQYVHTFHVNLINGRRLLLLDPSALSAMNIKDFDHIKHITYGIRELFYFEMTKFGRSVTLAPEYHLELYKLMRTKSGTKYETMRRSEFLHCMQLITQNIAVPRNHWDVLEHWLNREPEVMEPVVVSTGRRLQIYKLCKESGVQAPIESMPCKCIPPCECAWTAREKRRPWTLECLPRQMSSSGNKDEIVRSVLQEQYPERCGLRVLKSSSDFFLN